jgi:hypothetical protein
MMKKFAVALLASAALSLPAIAASTDQQTQQPQMQQQSQQSQAQNTNRSQAQPKSTNQAAQSQPSAKQNRPATARQNPPAANKSAQNQPNQMKTISPKGLSGSQIRQVQQALHKDGYQVGRVDGRWGAKTSDAVKQFQQSKNIKANGQLDQQTLSDLGLNGAHFAQGENAAPQR